MESNRFGSGLDIQAFDELAKSIEFTEERELLAFADASVGMIVEDFIASPVGRYVVGRAKQEIQEFVTWSLTPEANAANFEAKRAKALAARTLITWLGEQVADGLNAAKELNADQ